MCIFKGALFFIILEFYDFSYADYFKPIEINLRLPFHSSKPKPYSDNYRYDGIREIREGERDQYFEGYEGQQTLQGNSTDSNQSTNIYVPDDDSQIQFIDHNNTDLLEGLVVSSDPGIKDVVDIIPNNGDRQMDDGDFAGSLLPYGKKHSIRANRPCVPGVLYKLDCNTCQCNERKILLCTQWKCPEKYAIDYDEEEYECHDGEKYKKDCNTCTCIDGHFVCTKMGCGKLKPVDWSNKQCIPGKFYQVKCNRCSCTSEYKLKCTIHKCNRYNQIKRCPTGFTTKLDCNVCSCMEDGQLHCTKRVCTEAVSTLYVCIPGEVFKKGCKVCKCNNYGTGGACTNKLCHSHHIIIYGSGNYGSSQPS